MILVELTTDHDLKPFDCGDADLNGFLMDNAKLFAEKRIGKTFLLMDGDVIAAYFCLFNDKISRFEVSNSAWRKVKKLFPHGKHFCSYPAVKIGRFAVAKDYHHTGVGSELMWSVKHLLLPLTLISPPFPFTKKTVSRCWLPMIVILIPASCTST